MSTTQSTLAAVAMAAALVLAGCAGGLSNGTVSNDTAADADDGAAMPAGVEVDGGGTVQFYVSDERNAIDDFAHLNVTITKVGLHRTGDLEGSDAPTGTATTAADGTATPEPTEADEDGNGDAEWVEYEVNRTVDLTELKGANATRLESLVAPNGTYDKVFVYVSGIEATLKNGETVNVKLPSERLHINKGFAIGDGEEVSFVFDISVHKAGKSGKYILKPVISQSGTGEEVDIEDVDEREGDRANGRDDENPDDEADEAERDDEAESETGDAAGDLTAEFQGPVRAGKDATVKVTGADGPVANATVTVNGEQVGTTDGSGTVTFAVPEDAEELEVTVTKGEREVELTERVKGTGGNQLLGAPA